MRRKRTKNQRRSTRGEDKFPETGARAGAQFFFESFSFCNVHRESVSGWAGFSLGRFDRVLYCKFKFHIEGKRKSNLKPAQPETLSR